MNLVSFGVFGLMFLIFLGIVSNSSSDSLDNIEEQIFLMNCPMPIFNGIATLNSIDGYAVNYTVSYPALNGTATEGTKFICTIDSITQNFSASTSIEPYGATLFDFIPFGWLGYLADILTAMFQSVQAIFTLISFFVAPTNFNILGFTLSDLSGLALAAIVSLYALCYVSIGAMLYKVLSPFSGAG
jgi:hypothetical protein